MNKLIDLQKIFDDQENFSQNFYDKKHLSSKEKEEILKTLCLGLQQETSQIVSSTNFKVYNKETYEINKGNLLFGIADSLRYLIALSNLYDINPEDIISSYSQKDIFLKNQHRINTEEKEISKVIIVDIDDILCDFRSYFNSWLETEYGVDIDKNSESYYTTKEVKEIGLSPEAVFEEFLDRDELLNIPLIEGGKEFLEAAKENNIYVQLLTSRPEFNLKCKYQTYTWLDQNKIHYDNLGFAPEKFIWLSKKEYYLQNKVAFAIDDSPKHALEYATHGIKVAIPNLPYNKNAVHENIERFQRESMFESLKENLI